MEQELKVKISGDIDGLKKAVNESTKELDRLNAAQERVGNKLKSLTGISLQYEKTLSDLNERYRKGELTQSKFNKATETAGALLADARNEISVYQREQDRLAKQIDRAKDALVSKSQATNSDTASTQKNTAATKVNTSATKQNDSALIRHVYNQRAALSASNNLTRGLVAAGAGGRTMALGLGVATRQLATLAISTTSASGGMAALGASLMGPGGIAIATSVAVTAITSYVASSMTAKRSTEDLSESTKLLASNQSVLSAAMSNTEYQEAIASIISLKNNVDLAREGLISKEDVVRQYNNTLGKAAGEVKTLDEVERSITRNADAYVKAMLYKSAATLAVQKSAESALAAQLELNKTDKETVDFWASGLANSNDPKTMGLYRNNAERNRKTVADEHTKNQKQFEDIAKDFQRQAAEIAQSFGLNIFGTPNAVKESVKSITDAIIAERDKLYISSRDGRDRDVAETEIHYRKLLEMAEGNSSAIAELEELQAERLAQIHKKWDEKEQRERERAAAKQGESSYAIAIQYTRRLYETRSQMLKRQLDFEFSERVKQANKELKTEKEKIERQLQLQEEYWRRLDAIRKVEEMERAANSFGDAIGNAFERTLSDGTNVFKALGDEFKRMVIRMIADAARIQAIKLFNNLLGNGNTGDNTSSTQGIGQWVSALAGVFASSGSGGQWLNGLTNSFQSNGTGGQWLSSFANTFSSSGNGGQWLSMLGSLFGSGGSAGGWLSSLLTGLSGRGGSFGGWGGYNPIPFNMRPINDFGGGKFPARAPVTNPGFIPGLTAGKNNIQVIVDGQIKGDVIRIANTRATRLNDRFNGGQ